MLQCELFSHEICDFSMKILFIQLNFVDTTPLAVKVYPQFVLIEAIAHIEGTHFHILFLIIPITVFVLTQGYTVRIFRY